MTRVSKQKATIIGIMAVFFWAAMIGFMRLTSEAFGPTLGPALIYTLSALGLLIVRTPKNIRKMPRKYLLIGGILMVYVEIASTMAYALCLYRAKATPTRVMLARFFICFLVNVVLQQLIFAWWYVYIGNPDKAKDQILGIMTVARIFKNLCMFPIESVVLTIFLRFMLPITRRAKLT